MDIMTPEHPRWEEFVERLEGPEACNFHELTPGDPNSVRWTCGGGTNTDFARAILASMEGVDVKGSIAYFAEHGGYCDCEILLNVA